MTGRPRLIAEGFLIGLRLNGGAKTDALAAKHGALIQEEALKIEWQKRVAAIERILAMRRG